MSYQFKVGDTFVNSKKDTVKIIMLNSYDITVEKPNGVKYAITIRNTINGLNSGLYTNYKPVNQSTEEVKYEVGDWVKVISDSYTSHKPNIKTAVFQIEHISSDYKLHSIDTGKYGWINKHDVVKALPHEIPTSTKQWKKEDFYNTKIIVDTPEKSRRFQEWLYNNFNMKFSKVNSCLGSKYIYINKTHSLGTSKDTNYFNNHSYKEIFYDEIFNNNSITTIKNNNQNEHKEKSNSTNVYGKNHSIGQSKTVGRVRVSSRRQQISTGSRPKGNITRANTTKTSIRRAKICGQLVFRSNT